MRKLWLGAAVGFALLAFGAFALVTTAGGNEDSLRAKLVGYSEVPAVSTKAKGSFRAEINGNTIDYRLKYSGLEGDVKFAHIHFAQEDVNGGVAAFLCGGGDKPACPQSGEVRGTIDSADVIGPADQGIAAGEIGELIRAIENGKTYANVHSSKFPNGEMRGQIEGEDEGD
jgi:hypothetical protein